MKTWHAVGLPDRDRDMENASPVVTASPVICPELSLVVVELLLDRRQPRRDLGNVASVLGS